MQKNPSAHSMSVFIGVAVVGLLVVQVGIASQVSSTTTRAQDPGVCAGAPRRARRFLV